MSSLISPLVEDGEHEGKKTSFPATVFHGLNALSGVGILSVPYALASGGWLSLTLLLAIAIVAFYTGLLLMRCMDAEADIKTYPDIGELAFGKKGRILVSVVMYAELYLVAIGFLILEGDNLHNLFPQFGVRVGDFHFGGRQCFVVIVALIVLPSVWLDNLSLLSYISASGVLASAVILLSISWAAAFDGIGFQQKGETLRINGVPTATSLFAFCYCAHPVFPTLYTSMKNKRQFSKVLLICFAVSTVSYALMAIIGYLMFGEDVKSQVTLNLPTRLWSSRFAIYTTFINPIAKYALMVTPIINAARHNFPAICSKRQGKRIVGTGLVASNVVLAISIPLFGDLMSLVGAFLSTTASIIIPSLCYLRISGKYARMDAEGVLIVCVILLGVGVAVFGTYTSLVGILRHL